MRNLLGGDFDRCGENFSVKFEKNGVADCERDRNLDLPAGEIWAKNFSVVGLNFANAQAKFQSVLASSKRKFSSVADLAQDGNLRAKFSKNNVARSSAGENLVAKFSGMYGVGSNFGSAMNVAQYRNLGSCDGKFSSLTSSERDVNLSASGVNFDRPVRKMKIVLATSNADKVREIKEFLCEYEIYALREVMEPFEIVEDGASFAANALIKARAVYERLVALNLHGEFIALSDDSGISVGVLGGAPGIYSARYSDLDAQGRVAGSGATDASNRAKLIAELKARSLRSSPAFYTACIAVASRFGEFAAHGFMHGRAIDEERGENGFGYDFMFIPDGYERTIGELDGETKLKISHRSKGLELIKPVLWSLNRHFNASALC